MGAHAIGVYRSAQRSWALIANTAGRWSDAELPELGNMLVRGLSIGEIARLLRRDHGEVRDKIAEVGRTCRSATTSSEPAKVF